MPSVIVQKKITSSKGFFTGFLNLTIDKAPIIPNDNAILPDIAFVIIKVTTGNKINVNEW
jgi:hypothetical protein